MENIPKYLIRCGCSKETSSNFHIVYVVKAYFTENPAPFGLDYPLLFAADLSFDLSTHLTDRDGATCMRWESIDPRHFGGAPYYRRTWSLNCLCLTPIRPHTLKFPVTKSLHVAEESRDRRLRLISHVEGHISHRLQRRIGIIQALTTGSFTKPEI